MPPISSCRKKSANATLVLFHKHLELTRCPVLSQMYTNMISLNPHQAYKVGVIIFTSSLKMKKLRHEGIEKLVQDHS